MPNWMEGTLRLRGEKRDLERFFRSGLGVPSPLSEERLKEFVEIFEDCGSYFVITKSDTYISGTRRAFLDDNWIEIIEPYETIALRARQAWCFEAKEFAEIAKKYNLDVRLYGFECGMRFCQDIEIIDGNIAKDEVIKYNDWLWDCPMPTLGG